MTNLNSVLKTRNNALPTKVHIVKALIFPVVMYGCESWTIRKADIECQRIDALNCGVGEDSWEPLGLQEIQPVNPKGNQSWYSLEGTDAKAEAPIIWSPDAQSTHWKRPWCWERLKAGGEGDTGWYHWLNRHESVEQGLERFEQGLGGGEGQRSLVCCSPWGHKESDMTKKLNNNKSEQKCYS